MTTEQYPDDVYAEETGLNLFDDRASLAGSFPHAMFGYDKANVDTHVREIEQQLSTLKQLTRHLRQQLRDAQLTQGTTDFTRLGAHATGVLRAAEAQSRDLVAKAELEAERIKEEGRRVASDLRANAQTEADDIRVAGLANLRELRAELDTNVEAALGAARADAASTVAAAQRHADAIRLETEQRAANLMKAAEAAAQRLRAETDRANADAVQQTQHEIETMLSRAEVALNQTRATSDSMLADATRHHEASAEKLRDEAAEAQKIRAEALADAEGIKAKAARDSEAQIAGAHRQASMMKDRLEEQFAWRKEQIERETNALLQRKASVIAQMANLRQLAGDSTADFPDADPFAHHPESVGSTPAEPDQLSASDPSPAEVSSVPTQQVDADWREPVDAVQTDAMPTDAMPTEHIAQPNDVEPTTALDSTSTQVIPAVPSSPSTPVEVDTDQTLVRDPRSRRR